MSNIVNLIIKSLNANKDEVLLQDFDFDSDKENELLLFFKPECFMVETEDTKKLLTMAIEKIRSFDAEIKGAMLFTGKRLNEIGAMDRHYGLINSISKNASTKLSDIEKNQIKKLLELNNLDEYKIMGGHEFLQEYKKFNENSLDKFWLSEKSIKLRSGIYLRKVTANEENVILINGFHPSQLAHYTDPSHKIVVLLLHSNTSWRSLKAELAGNTFPEKASSESIRGELYKNIAEYNIKDVSIANNFVHLSAGPFEAFFEINNFLSNADSINFDLSNSGMYKKMSSQNCDKEKIMCSMDNPITNTGTSEIDLYTHTEDTDTSKAIHDYISSWK